VAETTGGAGSHTRPVADKDPERRPPLTGVRVLDLTRLLPGGYASQLLADLGADVIKVEDPRGGDYSRSMAPLFAGVGIYYLATNRSKRSVALDLKDPLGATAFRRLAANADVVLESFRPGVMDRLGVGYETLRRDNPRLVYCAISGYGQDGPYRQRAGHDLNYAGYGGLVYHNRRGNAAPAMPATQFNDIAGGALMAVVGILAALVGRAQDGAGRFVDAAMLEGGMALMPLLAALTLNMAPEPAPGAAPLQGALPCYNIYETSDGKYVTLGALEPQFWANFCRLVGRSDLLPLQMPVDEGERWRAISELRDLFITRTRAEWLELLADEDVCLGPVNSLTEAFADPHIQERGIVAEVPVGAGQTFHALRLIPRLSDVAVPPGPPPALGEHTVAALGEAGLSEEEIAALRQAGVIRS
jgi:alpha-methylacyl-CoA racemase